MESGSAVDGAAAASPPSQQHEVPSDGPDTRTAEERLRALQEKTHTWKAAVAQQFQEAAAKNRVLREELKAAKEGGERALVDLRVQLSTEYKERTAMLQEEVAALHEQVAAMRREKTELTSAHAADLQAAEARGRDTGRLDMEKEKREAEEKLQAELGKLTAALGSKENEVSAAQHEASLLSARLERLGEQYSELSSLIKVDSALDGQGGSGADTRSGGLAQAVNDTAHQRQLEAVRADLAGKEQQALRLVERAKAEHQQERLQLLREVQSRDEQLAVLQELLRQSQSELSSSHQRISQAQAETQRQELYYAARVSSLSQELATQLERLEEAQQSSAELTRQLTIARETVASLEEDAASREEAFQALLLSEGNKQIVGELVHTANTAREEAENWKLKFYELQQQQSHPERRRRPKRASGHAAGGAGFGREEAPPPHSQPQAEEEEAANSTEEDVDERLLKVERREAELAAQSIQLEKRAQTLRAAEVKLEAIKKSVAQQASMILSNGGDRSHNDSKNPSEGGGGGGRWAATARRPPPYFDSFSEEQSRLRRLARVLRSLMSTRPRLALLTCCTLLLFSLLVSFTFSMNEVSRSTDSWT